MQEPVSYLPQGFLAGGVFLLILCCWCGWNRMRRSQAQVRKGRMICQFFGVVYLIALLNMVFFSREPGSRIGVNLELLGTWGDTVTSQGYVIENILLFIPYGILVPGSLPFLRNGVICILSAGLFSTGIELVQFVSQRGYCQLDDVVMNTAGAAFGWGCYGLISCLTGLVFPGKKQYTDGSTK